MVAMTSFVALIRGINVGGHKLVAMADMRQMLDDLGLPEGRSLLQSGNLIFKSPKRTAAQLERLLETEAKKRLGLEADFFVRSAADLDAIIEGNPLPREAEREPSGFVVVFLRDAPDEEHVEALQSAIKGRETVRVAGRHAYIFYGEGMGRSKLTNAVIEKRLATRGTARNWNTVNKLAVLVRE